MLFVGVVFEAVFELPWLQEGSSSVSLSMILLNFSGRQTSLWRVFYCGPAASSLVLTTSVYVVFSSAIRLELVWSVFQLSQSS